jgi:hypothetical protein
MGGACSAYEEVEKLIEHISIQTGRKKATREDYLRGILGNTDGVD